MWKELMSHDGSHMPSKLSSAYMIKGRLGAELLQIKIWKMNPAFNFAEMSPRDHSDISLIF